MDRAIFIAMTGAKHVEQAQALHANNIANANTDGFRADFAQARSRGVYYGDGHPSRAYVTTETPGSNFNQGALKETGRDLDIAVEGAGLIAVQAPDGTEAYTRAGSLRLDAVGRLLTGSGLPVLGNGGPVALPPSEKIELGLDGTITVQPRGQNAEVLAQVDRIKLVNPEPGTLRKGSDGLLRSTVDNELPADAAVRIQTGFLESSNVNLVEEMTQVISLARQFEMQVKMMNAVDENVSAASRLLQDS